MWVKPFLGFCLWSQVYEYSSLDSNEVYEFTSGPKLFSAGLSCMYIHVHVKY